MNTYPTTMLRRITASVTVAIGAGAIAAATLAMAPAANADFDSCVKTGSFKSCCIRNNGTYSSEPGRNSCVFGPAPATDNHGSRTRSAN